MNGPLLINWSQARMESFIQFWKTQCLGSNCISICQRWRSPICGTAIDSIGPCLCICWRSLRCMLPSPLEPNELLWNCAPRPPDSDQAYVFFSSSSAPRQSCISPTMLLGKRLLLSRPEKTKSWPAQTYTAWRSRLAHAGAWIICSADVAASGSSWNRTHHYISSLRRV
jgi:hypothetical protein